MAKKSKSSAPKSQTRHTSRVTSRSGRGGRGRRIAGAVGRGLFPGGTFALAAGALAALIVTPMVLDKIDATKPTATDPIPWMRVAARFGIGLAGYHLANKVAKQPGLAQGFYVTALATAVGEGYTKIKSGMKGLGQGSMPVYDQRNPDSPGPALVGNGARSLAAAEPRYVIATDGSILKVMNQ